jgi:hypothetical protein
MKSGDHSNEQIDRNREGEEKHQTGCKVASESVTDETQAVAYEPRFTTFSGLQDQTLPAQGRGTGVAEFVLGDKQSGKEFTASGERHVPRLSFMEGLRAQLDRARTPEDADQLQSAFSIEYMMRKMKELAASAMSVFTDKPRQGTGKLEQEGQSAQTNAEQKEKAGNVPEPTIQPNKTFSNPREFIADLTRRHGVPDATLIADNPSVASDTSPVLENNLVTRVPSAMPTEGLGLSEAPLLGHLPDSVLAFEANQADGQQLAVKLTLAQNYKPASGKKASDGAAKEQFGSGIHKFIEGFIKDKREESKKIDKYEHGWEKIGQPHEIKNEGAAVLEASQSVLDSDKRNVGEFNFAIGKKDGKLWISSIWYNDGLKQGDHELHSPKGIEELKAMKVEPIVLGGHTHPRREGMGYMIFSDNDLLTANREDGMQHMTIASGGGTFKSFLLTPAPENKLLLYSADYQSEALTHEQALKVGRIVELGHFLKTGKFIPNTLEQRELLKSLGFIE